jgi:hypothetical protein
MLSHRAHTVSMSEHRPGDHILNRYLPNATEAVREESRENLKRLARLLIRVHERLLLDNPQQAIRATEDSTVESESLPTSI